jgi:hypothetical protein
LLAVGQLPDQVRVLAQRCHDANLDRAEVGRDQQVAGVGGDAGPDTAMTGQLLKIRPDAGHAPGSCPQRVDGGPGSAVALLAQHPVRPQERRQHGLVVPVVQDRGDELPGLARRALETVKHARRDAGLPLRERATGFGPGQLHAQRGEPVGQLPIASRILHAQFPDDATGRVHRRAVLGLQPVDLRVVNP